MKKVASTKFSILFSRKFVIALLLALVLWGGGSINVKISNAQGTSGYVPQATDGSNLGVAGATDDASQSDGKASASAGQKVSARTPEERRAECEKNGPMQPVALSQCIADLIRQENPPEGLLEFLSSWGKNMSMMFGDVLTKTVLSVNGIILQVILVPILSILFRLSSYLLDTATQFTLSTATIEGDGVALGITVVWTMIRDICNITFIFILLWAAIQMIIGAASANTKKTIAAVVVSALLINFSLFITRVVVDAGNILGVSLYNSMGITEHGMGTEIMNKLGLQTLWKTEDAANISVFSVAFGVVSYLQVITLLIGFIVFIYAALLMVARSVVLIFLMALSPIGFMGSVIPKFEEYSKMWRETLYGQVMIAPVFLLFVYLIIQIAGAFQDAAKSLPNIDEGSAQYSAYFKFIMVIFLLIVAVKTTKKMTGEIGKIVEKAGTWAAGTALGLATGGVALAGRQLVGRAATDKLNGEYGKDLRAKADGGDRVAQAKLKSLELASRSTYDMRNVKSVNKALGYVSDQAGLKIDAGKASGIYSKDGKQTGFAGAQQSEQEKANKAYNEAQKGVTASDRVAARDAIDRRDRAVNTALQTNTKHQTAKNEIERLEREGLAGNAELLKASKEQRDASLDVTTAATPEQKRLAEERLKKAKKGYADKKAELIKKNQEKYKNEIDENNKVIKEETRKTQIEVEKTLSGDDQKKIARVERARNLAQAMRESKVGIASIFRTEKRNTQIANKMESQKEKTEAELLREEMQEMRREAREAAKK